MQARRLWFRLLGTLALAVLPAAITALPVGEEFQINSYTTDYQFRASVASDADGNFVVVWESDWQDGDNEGIFGQRYDSEGVPQGREFRVNSYTTGLQGATSVASDSSGNFVVVWQSQPNGGADVNSFGQRYDNGGGTLGSEFRVNSYTTSSQESPSVASDASGNFAVVWQSFGQDGDEGSIYGQRYDSEGGPLGSEFRVNTYTTFQQLFPQVASDPSGDFVVVWTSTCTSPNCNGQDGSGAGVFGQRYNSDGVAQGDEFRVNSYTTGHQRGPSVTFDTSGNFVVVWSSYGQEVPGPLGGVFGQRYDSAGGTLGSEFQVNTYTFDSQDNPSVASDASGNFVVVWESYGQDGFSYSIFGQRYDNGGVRQGAEFRVSSSGFYQVNASVTAAAEGTFVVAWQSDGQDGDTWGVFGQRFNFTGDTITVVSPNTNVKWRIGSLHQIQWTHNLGGGETFRIRLDRDDDGNYEELIADGVPVETAARGQFAWTVSGPPSGTARVRISWTDDLSVSDASDVTFQIRP